MWNVNTETLADGDRTNNLATWNKAFAVLVGHSHPSVPGLLGLGLGLGLEAKFSGLGLGL